MKELIRKILKEYTEEGLSKLIASYFSYLNREKPKTKKELKQLIKDTLPMINKKENEVELYYNLYLSNYREDGRYDLIPPEELIGPSQFASKRTTNVKSDTFTKNKMPFKGSNLEGRWEKDGRGVKYYVVISYGWYPIYLFKEGVWYKVTESYSSSTGRQLSNASPVDYDDEIGKDIIWVSKKEMEKLIDGATYDEIMRGKTEGLLRDKEDFISKRVRFAQDWGYGEDYTPIKVRFKITDIREEGDKAVIDVTIEDAGIRKQEESPHGSGYMVTSNKMVPSQGGYLRGEIPNVNKEKVEKVIKNRILHDYKDFIGRSPYWTGDEYDLEKFGDKTKIRFNFIHKFENQ